MFSNKLGSAVVSCRRGGATAALDEINKYFGISNMPIVSSQYWNMVHGNNPEEVLKDEKDPILLCYEKEGQFCHRHVLAEFVNLKYGIYVPDISISEGLEIIEHKKPEYIREILQKLMEKEVER